MAAACNLPHASTTPDCVGWQWECAATLLLLLLHTPPILLLLPARGLHGAWRPGGELAGVWQRRTQGAGRANPRLLRWLPASVPTCGSRTSSQGANLRARACRQTPSPLPCPAAAAQGQLDDVLLALQCSGPRRWAVLMRRNPAPLWLAAVDAGILCLPTAPPCCREPPRQVNCAARLHGGVVHRSTPLLLQGNAQVHARRATGASCSGQLSGCTACWGATCWFARGSPSSPVLVLCAVNTRHQAVLGPKSPTPALERVRNVWHR